MNVHNFLYLSENSEQTIAKLNPNSCKIIYHR